MRSLTPDDCGRWSAGHGFGLVPPQSPLPAEPHEVVVPLSPLRPRTAWFSRYLAWCVGGYAECLLWVTLSGVWPSSENLHLFRRLRSSYGEGRSLEDAPGQVFGAGESDDLTSFVQLAILNIWDFHLLAAGSRARVFASHDEFLHLFLQDRVLLSSVQAGLSSARVEFEVSR
jgi:hypothetical protein